MSTRFSITSSGGSRDGNRYAVLDSLERDEHGGRKRVSFHKTWKQAQAAAKRLNQLTRTGE